MLIMNKLSPENKAIYLADMVDALKVELKKVKEENHYLQRIYNNACVMRDHYKAKLDKLEVKP